MLYHAILYHVFYCMIVQYRTIETDRTPTAFVYKQNHVTTDRLSDSDRTLTDDNKDNTLSDHET